MNQSNAIVDKELFLKNMEQLSLKIEQLTDEFSNIKNKLNKSNLINRSFGLKALHNSHTLDFAKDVPGIGSPTKDYKLSIRAISEEWKGRKNDILIAIRQQEKETHADVKSLGIRIPISDVKTLRVLTQEILSILYVACELKAIDINQLLRDILIEINQNGKKILNEIKEKMKV
ncbi:MAG: hypothetical protein ACFFBP_06395 [Promethearchaeota archaeon]